MEANQQATKIDQKWTKIRSWNTRGFRPQTRVELGLTSGFSLKKLIEWVFVSNSGFDAPYGVERGSRVSRRGAVVFWSWGHFGSLFPLFSHFSRIFLFSALILASAINFFRFFLIFLRFFLDLGGVSGWFFQRFLIFFRKHAQPCGSQQNTAWAHEF